MASPFNYSQLTSSITEAGKTTANSVDSNVSNAFKNMSGNVIGDAVNRITPYQIKNPGSAANNILASIPQNPINKALKDIAGVDVVGMNPYGIQGKLKAHMVALKANVLTGLRQCIYNSLRSLIYKTLDSLKIRKLPGLDDFVNAQIRIGVELDKIRQRLEAAIDEALRKAKLDKLSDFELAKMQYKLSAEMNQICNKLSPKDKKGLSVHNASIDIFAAQATDSIMNKFEQAVVNQKKGNTTGKSTNYFDPKTGLINQAAFESLNNPLLTVSNDKDKLGVEVDLAKAATPKARTLFVS
jgi:hypothetical protein